MRFSRWSKNSEVLLSTMKALKTEKRYEPRKKKTRLKNDRMKLISK